jgi:hypothetical protein
MDIKAFFFLTFLLGDCYVLAPKRLKNKPNYDDSDEKRDVRHVFSRQKMHILQ